MELVAHVDRSTWTLPPIFSLVARAGEVAREDLERTLNCGVGMVALTVPADADRAVELLARHGVEAWVAGSVSLAEPTGPALGGRVLLHGEHR